MALVIRKYEPRDLDDILDAWEAASRIAHSFLSDTFFREERELIANVFLKRSETWVAEVDGKVVGYMSLLGNEIGGLFVHPDCHRQGAGTALLAKAKERHDTLEVEVFAKNAIGRAFYAKSGFQYESEGIIEHVGENALCLELRGD